jgi:hypothetical protein
MVVEALTAGESFECLVDLLGTGDGAARAAAELRVVEVSVAGLTDQANWHISATI